MWWDAQHTSLRGPHYSSGSKPFHPRVVCVDVTGDHISLASDVAVWETTSIECEPWNSPFSLSILTQREGGWFLSSLWPAGWLTQSLNHLFWDCSISVPLVVRRSLKHLSVSELIVRMLIILFSWVALHCLAGQYLKLPPRKAEHWRPDWGQLKANSIAGPGSSSYRWVLRHWNAWFLVECPVECWPAKRNVNSLQPRSQLHGCFMDVIAMRQTHAPTEQLSRNAQTLYGVMVFEQGGDKERCMT